MRKTEYGSFDDLMVEVDPELERIARTLRAVILDVDPGAVEVVRLGDRAATYGVGPKKMSEGYVYVMPQSAWVNLGFYKGADLDDPLGLLEGTGAKMRHVKVRSFAETEQPELRALVSMAVAERREALGISDTTD